MNELSQIILIIAFLLNVLMLFLVLIQMKKTANRDYIQLSYSSVEIGSVVGLVRDAIRKCIDYGIHVEYGKQINIENVEKIYHNSELKTTVHNVLNQLDKISIGVLCGALEHDIAYELNSNAIINAYKTFESYIGYVQKLYGGGIAWSHFQFLKNKWEELRKVRTISIESKTGLERLQSDMIKVSQTFLNAYTDALKISEK